VQTSQALSHYNAYSYHDEFFLIPLMHFIYSEKNFLKKVHVYFM